MSTGRDLISRVRSSNKLVNADNTITDRAIYKELKSKASLLIKRETNLRRLWNSPNIFTPLECIAMEQVPLAECCDYTHPCTIVRSKEKIPHIGEGIFGLLVQYVFSPGMRSFDYASPDRFVNILKLGVANTNKYYWIYNERLYATDKNVEALNMSVYLDEEIDIASLSICPTKEQLAQSCINPLDKPFKIPSYLEDNLVSMVSDFLSKTYFRHTVDKTPDKKDTQDRE